MSTEAIKPLAGKDIATLTNVELVTEVCRLLTEIDRLQRENAELRKDRYDLAYAITGGEDAPGLLDSVATSQLVEIARDTHRSHSADIDRAEAAEAEVKRLRSGIKWCLDRDKRNGSLPGSYADKLQALASTGGDHHGN